MTVKDIIEKIQNGEIALNEGGMQFYQGSVKRVPEEYWNYPVEKMWKSFSGLLNLSVK